MANARRLSTSSGGSSRRSWLAGRWLSLGLAVAAVVAVGLSGSLVFGSIPQARRGSSATDDLQTETSKIQVLVSGQANDEHSYLLSGDPSYLTEFAAKQSQVEVVLQNLAADDPPTVRKAMANAVPAYRSFLSDHAELTTLFQSGDRSGATALALGHGNQSRQSAQAAFAAAATEVVSQSARETAHDARLTDLAGVALIVLGLGLLMADAELIRRVGRQRRDAAALHDSERHLRTLVDHIPAAVYNVDMDGVVLAWNPAASAMFGWSEAEAVGQVLPFVSADHFGEFAHLRAEVAAGRTFNGLETTRRRKDGTIIDVSISTAPVLDNAGQVVGIIGISFDITNRKRAEVELDSHRRGDHHLAAIVSASADAIMSTSLDGTLTSWNAGAESMFGYRAAEAVGQPLDMLCRSQDRAEQRQQIKRVLDGHSVIGAKRIRVRQDGTEFPVALTVSPVLDTDDRVIGVSGFVRDITAQTALQAALERQAFHDELTGLPNRVLFVDRLVLALARLPRHGGVVAVVFVDVDHFKVVNDSLGHHQGDRLLAMVAERLTAAVRPGDTVARFGGDEFAVLCEDLMGEAEAVAMGERIQQLATDPFELDGRDHWVTVSAGIAIAASADPSPAELLRDADSAMYQAKDSGRSCSVVFTQSMRTRARRRLDIETSLRRAITDGELRLHYQPIVNLSTGRTEGVEALVRWQHPTEGLVPPGEFIAVAEETGMIVPLGEWVLGEACRQARAWAEHPELAHLTVSVNLSARQIAQADAVAVVANVLAATGLAPSRLVLEITESVLMGDAAYAVTVLEALKGLGVQLSVDDFGTGYSSLSYLKRFPVDILKIDKSFVDGLGSDNDDSAIVTATINLAHSLGLTTVAEGTETAEQVQALTELGCDKAQGYLFGRPQPAAALTEHLLNKNQYRDPPFGPDRRPCI
jgi:diguanylate cyclase (GGDEF)-like protein/PAS domain S-box-containing protein